MMKKTVWIAGGVLAVLLIGGAVFFVGKGNFNQENDVVKGEVETIITETDKVITSETEETTASETEEMLSHVEIEAFAQLPDKFRLVNGSGKWGEDLFINSDGTFTGKFEDVAADLAGDEYPNGTVFICNYKGRFTTPVKVSEHVYSTTVESFSIEREGEEYIEDGFLYKVCEPEGFRNAGAILIYLYNTPSNEMAGNFVSTIREIESSNLHPEGELLCYGVYNINGQAAFTGYKYEKDEELSKLGGTFINEAGDKLIIHLEPDKFMYDLGSVEWYPVVDDGGIGSGNIKKNAKGGFTIYLDSSVSYEFKISDYEKTDIIHDSQTSNLGTFKKQ